MKICEICSKEYNPEFYNKTRQKYCTNCKKIGDRLKAKEYYLKNKEKFLLKSRKYRKTKIGKNNRKKELSNLKKRHPLKYKARYMLNSKIKEGKIRKRNSCEICHTSPTHCHHEDYTKPFEFVELCQPCHQFLHNQYRKMEIF